MKSAVESLNPTRVRLTVEVPFEELKPDLDTAYREIGRQVRISGFRPGKVPARILDQMEDRGIVGPADGSRFREVMVTSDGWGGDIGPDEGDG